MTNVHLHTIPTCRSPEISHVAHVSTDGVLATESLWNRSFARGGVVPSHLLPALKSSVDELEISLLERADADDRARDADVKTRTCIGELALHLYRLSQTVPSSYRSLRSAIVVEWVSDWARKYKDKFDNATKRVEAAMIEKRRLSHNLTVAINRLVLKCRALGFWG